MNIAPPPRLPDEGETIAGGFRLGGILGRGGMGIVRAGHHLRLQQPVAIKFLLPEHAAAPGPLARFLREARAAASLRGEHVTRILDVGATDEGVPFIVMEKLEGRNLDEVLQDDGPLPSSRAVDLVLQACEALAEAHGAGIVHRDLKPANLFVTKAPDGTPFLKVLDFGISKALHLEEEANVASITAPNSPLGSPQYMAPEQLRNAKSVDARCDVWSLGILLYELISGVTPFRAESLPHLYALILTAPAAALVELQPGVPAELCAVIRRCLAKNPHERIGTVVELAGLLAPFGPPDSAARVGRIVALARVAGPTASSPPRPLSSLELAETQAAHGGRRDQRKAAVLSAAATIVFLGLAVFAVVRRVSATASLAEPTLAPEALVARAVPAVDAAPAAIGSAAVSERAETTSSPPSARRAAPSDPLPSKAAGKRAPPRDLSSIQLLE